VRNDLYASFEPVIDEGFAGNYGEVVGIAVNAGCGLGVEATVSMDVTLAKRRRCGRP
jgi:hypothetical protein